eukprot:GEMP01040428.1.p1 GENE.GEMP01040428.1~~GEMP01040428.1.p1  ORF type:complete len:472 (+),score=132.08 GEMP01040428.1:54-1469(+)
MQAIDYADALNAWQNMTGSKGQNTWCIFAEGKQGDKRVLEVVGTGSGPGMRSAAQQIKTFTQKGLPAWGGFKVDAIDDRLNAKAVCSRFIGFQIIPDACSFTQRSKVLEVKGVIQTKVMTNLALMFECETWEELNDATGIAKRLRATCGAHVPTLYDFGGNEKRRTSVGERDGLPTSRPVLIVDLAQEAWRNIMDDKDDASYVLFGLNADKKRLQVLAGGGGPGLAGCKAAVEEVIKKQMPFWGGYRVYALDTKGNAATSVRTKFVGFQVIPEGTPPMAKAKVSIVKPMIQSRVMPHLSCFIEAETVEEICDPDIISDKLTKCAGSDAPTSYDFTAASKATINRAAKDPAAAAESAKKKEMEESIERERREQIDARQKQIEEAEKEREQNQHKADELMNEEAERRVQEDAKMPQDLPEGMKNILAGINQAVMAEAAQQKIEEVERAANQRFVDEEVAREQEERRVLLGRIY